MRDIPSDRLTEGTTFVAADGVAARQLEACLARRKLAESQTVWTGPSVSSYRAWITGLWSDAPQQDERQLLNPGQARGLWRRIIENSPISDHLMGSRTVVGWAMEAAQRLRDWGIDIHHLQARPDDPDFANFLDWARTYERTLAESGWADPGEVEVLLRGRERIPPPSADAVTIWADFEPMPGQKQLREQLRRAGYNLEWWHPAERQGTCDRIRFADSTDEIRAAARWATQRLSSDPDCRLAIVTPDLGIRREEIHRILEEHLSPERAYLGSDAAPGFVDLAGEPAERDPLIGSALTALELFSPRGHFGALSRWLRSPFFAPGAELTLRSRLEAELRVAVDAQLRFLEAFRAGELTERIRAGTPTLAAKLTEAIRLVDTETGRATPTRWVNVWRRLLRVLDWQDAASDPASLATWETALHELTQLSPVLGRVTAPQALSELQGILGQPRRAGPMPLSGVFVMPGPEDVGPGYDGIWVTGLTDTRWPRPARPTPILPLDLQRAHDMPLASPDEALTASRRAMLRLFGRAPQVVLSWPSQLHEYPTRPSPLILNYRELSEQALLRGENPSVAHRLFQSRARQALEDPVPPLPDQRVRGGARILDLQSACPLRAFLQIRLGAAPLEPVRRALSARHRGIAAHRAMELLFLSLPRRSDLQQAPDELRDRIHGSVARALREIFGRSRGPAEVVFELEARRLRAVLGDFVAMDLRRADFEVSAVEERVPVRVADLELHCRIDRLDVVTSTPEARAIIDYKTGRQGTPADWLRTRPRDVQLPLYALAVDRVSAAAIALLRSDGVQYKGIWPEGMFPGRSARLPEGRTWSTQLEVWREQLEALAREFAAGDSRLFEADLSLAQGPFAPVTRVYEQLALTRGWSERRNAE